MVERFDLERFEWNAPDRLEVSGQFKGLPELPGEPVLIVNGEGTAHRLQAAAAVAPTNGDQWSAEFVWDGVPVGVDSAVLELGPDVAIELPPPGGGSKEALDVRQTAHRLAAEQEAEELRAALERSEADLARARSDLESERAGRAADADRFLDGLAEVQAAAEQALATERAQAETVREKLDAAQTRLGAIEQAGTEAGDVRDDAERLLTRLTRLVDVLDAGK